MLDVFSAQREFAAYGPSHVVVLVVFVVGAATLVWLGRRQTESQARRFSGVMAVLLLAVFGIALVYKMLEPAMDTSVPLQLCDIAEVTAVYALWSQRHWAYALTYFWGLVLSTQALFTPDVGGPDFPGHLFLTFFALHLLVIWAAIYLTWGRGMRPRWRSYRFMVIATLAWAAFTIAFNVVANTNYGYLNGKPGGATLLDLMGEWPWYIVVVIALLAVFWALITWPWTSRAQAL